MLLVKTTVKPSQIHGQGLFADQNIRKGQIIWIYNTVIDKKISKKRFNNLPLIVKKFVKYWSYVNESNEYVLCGDDARYMNHSNNPNTEDVKTLLDRILGREGICIATKDIKKGQEITSDYL